MNALYIICGLGALSLIAEIINFRKGLIIALALGIVVAIAAVVADWGTSVSYFSNMVVFDNYAIAFTALICSAGLFWFWMARDYFHEEAHLTDQSSLVLFAIAGAIMLTSFNNMAMLFIGIEILSLSLYVLAGSRKDNLSSTEAAFKYFIMGSFATGFLLMGVALVYGATGQFHLDRIAEVSAAAEMPGLFYAGILMILVGIAFKVSAVPFHFWAPDVYDGSPTAITAFMSTVVKIAAFAAFVKLFNSCFASARGSWVMVMEVMTLLTLVIANYTAVSQASVKRMLAYSSVGHAGYIMLAVVSSNDSGRIVLYYLAAYASASLLAFTVLIEHERQTNDLSIKSFGGYFRRNRLMAAGMTVALMSLAGIPPLAGFFGKYLVFSIALQNGFIVLVILAILTSLIGVYYYFRVIVAMFAEPSEEKPIVVTGSVRMLILILMLMSLALGIFPDVVSLN